MSNDASAGDDPAQRVGALTSSLIAALAELSGELEVVRQRQAAPAEVEEFIASTRATLARLREEAPSEDSPA